VIHVLINRRRIPIGRCEEILYPVDPRWTLRLVDCPHDPSNLRLNLRLNPSTKLPRLRSLDLLNSDLRTDRRTGPLKVERMRMLVIPNYFLNRD
jgi:hypothetical protein